MMQASFWIQGHSRRITISDQQAVGVMVEVDERDEVLGPQEGREPEPDTGDSQGRRSPILCLSKGEARAIASAIMGAAAEL